MAPLVRTLAQITFAAVAAVAVVGCSTSETTYPDEPFDGPVDIEIESDGVVDGSEGGLNLDNGNVEGSSSDEDLDPYDEQLGLNTDESTQN